MSDKTGGPLSRGMTLRDWFAGQALAGYANLPDFYNMSAESLATMSYQQADAMLEEREKDNK